MSAPAIDLSTIKLASGGHPSPEQGACAMEWVSILAGEPFGDHPPCTSPVLADYVIRLNDGWDDEQRQKLVPYLPRLIGTAGSLDIDVKRAAAESASESASASWSASWSASASASWSASWSAALDLLDRMIDVGKPQ